MRDSKQKRAGPAAYLHMRTSAVWYRPHAHERRWTLLSSRKGAPRWVSRWYTAYMYSAWWRKATAYIDTSRAHERVISKFLGERGECTQAAAPGMI